MDDDRGRTDRLRSTWRMACLLGLVVAFLMPVLKTGYWAEDVHHSVVVPARQVLTEGTLLDEVVGHLEHTIGMGRFFPLTAILISVVHFLIRDVFTYKAFLVAMTALDVLIFHRFVRRLSGRAGFASVAACLTLGLFQLRIYVDPMLGYYAQMQLIVAALFASMTALLIYLEGRGLGWLAAGASSFAICPLTYEASYPLVLLPLCLIRWARPGRRAGAAAALPFLGIVGLCAAATVLVRRLHPADIYWHQTDFDPGGMLLALAQQTSAALPLSYFLADPLDLFPRVSDVPALIGWVLKGGTIAVALAAMAVSLVGIRREDRVGHAPAVSWPRIATLGLMLAVLPGAMITISPYHRSYLAFGVGWVPVFIQSFGVGMLLTTGLWLAIGCERTVGGVGRRRAMVASGLVAVLVGWTYRANCEVAISVNAPPGSPRYREFAGRHGASWHFHRLNLEAALDHGLMDEVPDHSVVRTSAEYPYWYDATYGSLFFAKHTGRQFATVPPSAIDAPRSGQGPVFQVRDALAGRRSGSVILWQVEDGDVAPDGRSGTSAVRAFIRRPELFRDGPRPSFLLVGEPEGTPGPPIVRRGDELTPIRSGRDWGLYAVEVPTGVGGPISWRVMFDPAKIAALTAQGDEGRATRR